MEHHEKDSKEQADWRSGSSASAIIAESDSDILGELEKRLAAIWPKLEIRASVRNGTEALAKIGELRPDVVFLDIQLPGLSGIDVARRMRHNSLPVFLTVFDELVDKMFAQADVIRLLKPLDERLDGAVESIRQRLADSRTSEKPAVFDNESFDEDKNLPCLQYVRTGSENGMRTIPVNDILLFQTQDAHTSVATEAGNLMINTPVSELRTMLDPRTFWQIRRSMIVNTGWIEAIQYKRRKITRSST